MPAMRDFFQRRGKFRPEEQPDDDRAEHHIPEDLWIKCPKCSELIYSRELERTDRVCPKCSYHFRLRARQRIGQLLDPGSFVEFHANILTEDPLVFRGWQWQLRPEAGTRRGTRAGNRKP